MVDAAFVQRTADIRSSIARGALVSEGQALGWLRQSQGAATYLQARPHAVCAALPRNTPADMPLC